MNFAVALKYSSGETPVVLLKSRDKEFADLVIQAYEYSIPVVESNFINSKIYDELIEGQEIPTMYYRDIAQAMALVFRHKNKPSNIRFLRLIENKKSRVQDKLEKIFIENKQIFQINSVKLELGTSLFENYDFISESIKNLRLKAVSDLGLILPEIIVDENKKLDDYQYVIYLKEIPYLKDNIEPLPQQKEKLLKIVSSMKKIIYDNSFDLIGYAETESYIKEAKKICPSLIKDVFSNDFSINQFKNIIKMLLKENIPVKNIISILEVISDNINTTHDPELLVEYIRSAFKNIFTAKYQDNEGYLNVILLDTSAENLILRSLKFNGKNYLIDISPEDGLKILTAVGNELKKSVEVGIKPVLLTSPNIRRFLRKIIKFTFDEVPVLSYSEISPQTQIKTIGTVIV